MPIPSEQLWKATPESAEAVDDCLRAACVGLHFDSAELWRKDTNYNGQTKYNFVRQFTAAHWDSSSPDDENPLETVGRDSPGRNKTTTTSLAKLVRIRIQSGD